jgi:hypothetical protein
VANLILPHSHDDGQHTAEEDTRISGQEDKRTIVADDSFCCFYSVLLWWVAAMCRLKCVVPHVFHAQTNASSGTRSGTSTEYSTCPYQMHLLTTIPGPRVPDPVLPAALILLLKLGCAPRSTTTPAVVQGLGQSGNLLRSGPLCGLPRPEI